MTLPGEMQDGLSSTLLLVDDQPSIVRALELGLKRRRFKVLTAGNGHDALAILASEQGIDMLISDIVMPGGISGFELARRALELRPGLPVLLTTGYSFDQVEAQAGRISDYEIMIKPFSLADLASRINDLLLPRGMET